MCGICGIWNKPEQAAVERMVTTMRHRGPDDHGIFIDEKISLGMTRLSIIDLTSAGHQPMSNPDQTIWIVYNGEVYNFLSERQQLEENGYTFSSNSDTEVILRLYEKYGDDFLLRLRGMFSLAIYDKRCGRGHEKLLLARDPLGIKPLLYSWQGHKLFFASELKAILSTGMVNTVVDLEALRMLLTYGSIYQPHTMLQNVNMLLPAHRMIVEAGSIKLERYWKIKEDRIPGLHEQSYNELVIKLASELEDTVRLHMVSDVPVGAFLSGGVDSSLLVGLMTRLAGHRIKTFSVGFEDEGATIDESGEAEKTAQFLGADHTRVVVTSSQVREQIEKIAFGLDQPSVDGVNSFFISQAASHAVTVAISGTGGDELFAGYPWFPQMVRYQQEVDLHPIKARIKKIGCDFSCLPLFDGMIAGRNSSILQKIRQSAGFVTNYSKNYQIFGVRGASRLLLPEIRSLARAGRSEGFDMHDLDELSLSSPVERVTALCLRGYTNNQLLRDIDSVSMIYSLEVRVPLLDTSLLNFVLSLPSSVKLSETQNCINPWEATYREMGSKKILMDAGKYLGVLREDIDIQPKRGFAMPFGTWLKGSLHDVMEDTLSESVIARRGLLDPLEVQRIKNGFLIDQKNWSQPWILMMLELWFRQILDKSREPFNA